MKGLGVLCLLLALTSLASGAASDIDLHAYWDQRCKDCHGHAGEFARHSLRVENGQLQGAHHRNNLSLFLRNHYLSDSLIEPVTAMLVGQVVTPPLFATHCTRCHGSAAEFARNSLSLRDGILLSAPSGRKVVDTLGSHGSLSPRDAQLVVDSLARVRGEVSSASSAAR